MTKPFSMPKETKKAVLAFYSMYYPSYDHTLCGYMKSLNQMDLIGYRGNDATKYEVGLRKQVEYYQKKLKNAEYLRNELARNGFNTCAGKEFDQQATPTSSPQSPPTPSPPSSPPSSPPPSPPPPTPPPVPPENQSESCQAEKKPKKDENRNQNVNQNGNQNENQNGNQNERQNEKRSCKFLLLLNTSHSSHKSIKHYSLIS